MNPASYIFRQLNEIGMRSQISEMALRDAPELEEVHRLDAFLSLARFIFEHRHELDKDEVFIRLNLNPPLEAIDEDYYRWGIYEVCYRASIFDVQYQALEYYDKNIRYLSEEAKWYKEENDTLLNILMAGSCE